jgi:hypothetical protein
MRLEKFFDPFAGIKMLFALENQRTWPARLQDEFGLAMKRLERRAWASKRNLA